MIAPLTPGQVRRTVSPEALGIRTTEELPPIDSIIGQERAVSALDFGLGIHEPGFNIYVSGEPGIGKMTAVRAFLENKSKTRPAPRDWCYVDNFSDHDQPRALSLPAGRGRALQQDMRSLVERLRRDVQRAFESDEYTSKRDDLVKEAEVGRNAILGELRAAAHRNGLGVQITPYGIVSMPLIDDHPITTEDFEKLPEQKQAELRHVGDVFQSEAQEAMRAVRELDRGIQEKLRELNQRVANFNVAGPMDDLRLKYNDLPEVVAYFDAAQADVLERIDLFITPPGAKTEESPAQPLWMRELPFRRYQVNVLVDNDGRQGAPVIVELNCSYPNLFGRVEKENQMGALYTDFTMVKPGALHRANGGYLVLPIEDLLRNGYSWEGLKRALRSGEVGIEELAEQLGLYSSKSIKPQPIPLTIKVLLVGRPPYRQLLSAYDEDFAELFKVKADFDTEMPLSDDNTQRVLRFVRMLCGREGLRHLDAPAAALLLEHSARMADDQTRLSTHFGELADSVREASYWAERENAPLIGRAHIAAALEHRRFRAGLAQDRLREMITRGALLIDVKGEAIGQVNGLSVLSVGDFAFGNPSRITASIEPGRRGIIDIEREVALGGPIHSKGILILSGYLAHRFGGDKPIALEARLVFEQSYAGVEGDSASSAELYALLSALSSLPVRQGIAVTGSVNQHGQVQAIGGVNEKIEGFFDVCAAFGLTGDQGVIIPASNLQNLMLREDVVAAMGDGRFRIWAIKTIDEGIEILTGVPAGERGADGRFGEGSVNGRIDRRLRELEALLEPKSSGPRARHGIPRRPWMV